MTTETLEKELKFSGIQPELIEESWPLVEPLVKKGLALEHSLYAPKDIFDLLVKKRMQLWAAIDPEAMQIVAVIVTQIAIYPNGKACWLVLVGGTEMNDWIKFMKVIKLWAKVQGCDRVLAYSRDGWIRQLAPYGFKKLRTLIGCSLENENGI